MSHTRDKELVKQISLHFYILIGDMVTDGYTPALIRGLRGETFEVQLANKTQPNPVLRITSDKDTVFHPMAAKLSAHWEWKGERDLAFEYSFLFRKLHVEMIHLHWTHELLKKLSDETCAFWAGPGAHKVGSVSDNMVQGGAP